MFICVARETFWVRVCGVLDPTGAVLELGIGDLLPAVFGLVFVGFNDDPVLVRGTFPVVERPWI